MLMGFASAYSNAHARNKKAHPQTDGKGGAGQFGQKGILYRSLQPDAEIPELRR
jgi:hypothetical protein